MKENTWMRRRDLFLGILMIAWNGGLVSAGTITTYLTRPEFNAAVDGPLTIEDFTDGSHFPISTGILNSETNLVVESGTPILPGDIQPGVTYSRPIEISYFFNIDAGGGFEGGFLDGFRIGDPDPVTMTFDGPVQAFGFDTNDLMGTSFQVTIFFTEGGPFVETYDVGQNLDLKFFGFVSSLTDIVAAQVQGFGEPVFDFAFDNFTFTQPIPEPASFLLLGVGTFGALAWTRRASKVARS